MRNNPFSLVPHTAGRYEKLLRIRFNDMELNLDKLNKEQKEAVLHNKGPLLIIAGAGTGKTTVITTRVAYLIEKKLVKPEEILALTFTDKAAEEMEERINCLLSYGYVDLWVSTFHSFCERILRDNALDIGLPNDFKILDPAAGWLLVYQNLARFKFDYYKSLGNPTKFIQALISHFSHCKDQGIYPEDYLAYADKLKSNLTDLPENQETERIKEIANAFHTYQRLLLENGSLDFGDLINYSLKLFKKRPLLLKKYREKFKYILVDEFQDTNWAQYELIKVLAAPKNNLTVTADDDQAIYLWRSASFNNIIQFGKDFPKAKQISLVRNYRSTQNILDQAYKFIKANDPDRLEYVNKINKKLVAEKKGKGVIEHIHAKTLDEEVRKTIKKILEILKNNKEANYSDFAILVRANNSANPFVRALERAGLPYQFLASQGLYAKPVILDVISYFKLLDNYHESSALYRILNLPFLKIPYEDIIKLTQYSARKTKSLYETLEEILLVQGIPEKTQKKISFVLYLIKKHSAMAREKAVSELLVAFLEDIGYLKYLAEKDDQVQLNLLNQFYKKVKTFEETVLEPTLKNFMAELNLEIESGEEGKIEFNLDEGPDMVRVMTIHGAKGLEFKYVFLVNMVDKRFPSIGRREPIELPDELIKDIKPSGDIHLQEERRLCYVAMTRAKKGLYFTSSEDYGGAKRKRLSRFLIEMGYKDKSKIQMTNVKSNLKFLNYQTTKRFGDRATIPIERDGLAKIQNGLLEKKPKLVQVKNKAESEYLPSHFSFSQLAAFEKCPLQYKFAFILKVPIKGKAVFSFGKTIHSVLFNFLKQANEVGKNNQEDLFGFKNTANKSPLKKSILSFEYLAGIYEENWLEEWYENKKQKEEYYKLGKKIIKDFYDEFSKNPPKILKINDRVALEIPFNLKIGGYDLHGAIDRIDELKDGAALIDYKTGDSREKLDLGDKKQLLIYQLAAKEVFKIEPKELIYYYLKDGKKVSFLGTAGEIERTKEKIVEEIGKIKNSDFKATPGWQCKFCDFKSICDYAK